MEVRHSSPRSLGVEQLMYVGDVAVDGTTAAKPAAPSATQMGVGALGAFAAVCAKRHPLLRGIGAMVALAVGVQYAQSR
jgi:hypothetical protein